MKHEIIITDRAEINEMFKARLGMEVSMTDEQWQKVADSIHNDNLLWRAIDIAIEDAVNGLTAPLIKTL